METSPSATNTPPTPPFDYERFVKLIRDELDRSLDPIKQGQERIEVNLAQTYTREVTNLLLKERDERLEALEVDVDEVKKHLGAFWMTTLTRVGAVAGTIAAVLGLWQLLTH